jgi:hypothetical protein
MQYVPNYHKLDASAVLHHCIYKFTFTYFLGYKTYTQNIWNSENIVQAHCAHVSERAAGLVCKVGRLLMSVVFVQNLMNLPFSSKF